MKKLSIEWKHFDKDGATCKRCSQTGSNLNAVIKKLKDEYASKDIKIEFQETKLSDSRMAESNQILIDGILLENLIPNITTGVNYCDSCSDLIDDPKGCNCRTVNQGENVYEEIPTNLIRQAIMNRLSKIADNNFNERKKMNIQVLGSGCPTCKKLYEITQKAVAEMNMVNNVEYIAGESGIQKIIELGAVSSPLLVVNGKIAMEGFNPDIERIKQAITSSMVSKTKQSGCSCGGNC